MGQIDGEREAYSIPQLFSPTQEAAQARRDSYGASVLRLLLPFTPVPPSHPHFFLPRIHTFSTPACCCHVCPLTYSSPR